MLLRYLIFQIARRIAVFFRRWYIDFSRAYWARVIERATFFDKAFAIKIMWKTLLQPLWGDYTPIGRIMGFFFRTARILAAVPFFFLYFGAAFLVWAAWLMVPAYLMFRFVVG